jgi:hypothetical protein
MNTLQARQHPAGAEPTELSLHVWRSLSRHKMCSNKKFFNALMMEAVRTSETSVSFNVTTRRHIPEDSKLQFFKIHLKNR